MCDEDKELIREIRISNLIGIYKMGILSPELKSKIISILTAYTKSSINNSLDDNDLFPKEDSYVKKLK